MPKAKKLPSGSWRCQVCVDGVKRSITVKDPTLTGKRKCEQLAAEWAAEVRTDKGALTLGKAIQRYIDSKEAVISPASKRMYDSLLAHAYPSLVRLPLSAVSEEAVQKWVNKYSSTHSPKSVRNAHALLTSSLKMFGAQMPRVTLPQKKPPELLTPTDKDVTLLIENAEGDLKKAIMLAAFGTLRRGEICGLVKDDIGRGFVTVRRSVVRSKEGWVVKMPKTASSVRRVSIPEQVAEQLTAHEDGRIISVTPNEITEQFVALRESLGLPPFRFHDLRAYAASIRHALGIPDVYIMADGGWKTDGVLKAIYRRQMDDKREQFSRVANDHFEGILRGISHGISHENEKAP